MKTPNEMPSLEYLNSIFEYKDGALYSKVPWGRNRFPVGFKVGTVSKGYLMLKLHQKRYSLHRVIFYMVHGWCPKIIDHIDGNGLNNKIENLRPATHSENLANQKLSLANKSGVKGVYWNKEKKMWSAEIGYNHKCKKLGYFKNLGLAKDFIDLARQMVHGKFANSGVHQGAMN